MSSVKLNAGADKTKKRRQQAFSSVSLPTPLLERIEDVVNELRYWPTKTAFVREASLEKLDKYTKEEWSQRR